MKKCCALYVRQSPLEPTGEIQCRDLKSFVEGKNLKINKIYHDYGVGPMGDRPELTELLKAAAMNRFEYIITWRLDRMFSSHQHLVSVVRDIQALGIGFISVKDEVDTTSENSALLTHLFQVFANFQGRVMAERAQAGINGSKRKGCFFGRDRKIDRKEALRLHNSGLRYSEIARRLSCSPGAASKVIRQSKLRQSLGVTI